MEDATNLIKELTIAVKNLPNFKYVPPVDHGPQEKILADLTNEAQSASRELTILTTEMQNKQLVRQRNEADFESYNTEKLNLAKKIVQLEQEIEKYKEEIADLQEKDSKLSHKLELCKQPDKNALFVELMAGFCMSFKEDSVQIMKENDIHTVKLDGTPECTDKIWELL